MYRDNGHMSVGWGIVMTLSMLTFWALVVFVTVRFLRSTLSSPPPTMTSTGMTGTATASAEGILAERLARGEIEPEDYRARLSTLTTPK